MHNEILKHAFDINKLEIVDSKKVFQVEPQLFLIRFCKVKEYLFCVLKL
jgi:hypothetical protein